MLKETEHYILSAAALRLRDNVLHHLEAIVYPPNKE